MSRENIKIKELEELTKLQLPSDEWKMVRADIKFERRGMEGEWASVVWDYSNSTFYVKTNKCTVYSDDSNALLEAISLMNAVNNIMNKESIK